jgi:DNA-binding CsgD family transcriptional regulator
MDTHAIATNGSVSHPAANGAARVAGGRSHGGSDALLALIGDVCGMLDLNELRWGLLDALHRALPSDYVSLNDVGPGPEDAIAIMKPDAPAASYRGWNLYAHQNPLLRFYLETLDGRAYRFSDVISRSELHRLELYREVYAPLGVEYQLAFTLPAGDERVLAIALSRAGHDYTDSERDFANRARPFLIQAYLNAIAFDALRAQGSAPAAELLDALRAAGLTRREAQVLRLVALGRSNHHVAAELGISSRTVGKHLEHGFRKLGVADRSSAARRVWELAGDRLELPRRASGDWRELHAQRLAGQTQAEQRAHTAAAV